MRNPSIDELHKDDLGCLPFFAPFSPLRVALTSGLQASQVDREPDQRREGGSKFLFAMSDCSAAERQVPVMQAEDKFRAMDRKIKQFVKGTQLASEKSKKRSWAEHSGDSSESLFCWSEVIDPLSSSCASRLRLLGRLPGCCFSEPHNCSNSDGAAMYEMEGYPSSLFLISNAVCDEGQLIWAQRALEVYSTAEHTNLSNLSKLQESIAPGDSVKAAEEDRNDLWKKSVQANDNFSSFSKLRWSCLGYHYGKQDGKGRGG